MAQLTAEQTQLVESWAEAGATLNDIQNRLKTDFGITLTYLEARMLMLDVGVKLNDKKKAEVPVESAPAPEPSKAVDGEPTVDDWTAGSDEAPQGAAGGVSVTADAIPLQGAIASGKATFSDGKTATWYVDQMGRLGVKASELGYQPPPQDIPLFEQQLDTLLQSL